MRVLTKHGGERPNNRDRFGYRLRLLHEIRWRVADNIKLDTQQYSRAGPGSGPRRQQISHYLAFKSSEIFLFSCRVGVSYSPGQPGTGYVAKDDLGFLILQLPPLGAGVIKVCPHETKVVREHASSPRPPPLPFSVYYMEEIEKQNRSVK